MHVKTLQKFIARLDRVDLSPKACWEWAGNLNSNGYGRLVIWKDNKWTLVYAHRLAWFLKTGDWSTKFICHKCDNPKCVRFSHLFEGTQLDNMQDCVQKGRHIAHNKDKLYCKRGHLLANENVYHHGKKRHCKPCRSLWKKQARLNGTY